MMNQVAAVLFLLATAAAAAAAAAPAAVQMVVAYCPTLETNEAAIVSVDATSGAFHIVRRFPLPQSVIFGCVANYDPNVYVDNVQKHVYLDFTSTGGAVLDIDLAAGNVSRVAAPSDPLFHGFINFYAVKGAVPDALKGITPTVTASGYCSDGCMAFGAMSMSSGGQSEQLATIPFKAVMDDAHWVDAASKTMYVQASYDLRAPGHTCSSNVTDMCMVGVDTDTGALKSSVATPSWTVYKYSHAAADAAISNEAGVLSWVAGPESECEHPYNNFLFGHVSPGAATMKPIACISKDVTVDTAEWIAAFSDDESLFATASGNAEAGEMQLLVLQPHTGATVLNTKLDGLPQALHAAQNLTWVWAIDFASN
eukprot:NODE_1808_length_1209_cov_47.543438_g1793_i0.p2 GENE.NODE_1808_length_1209_cov_47.543438_g1793_i0~~NODE_1808_length_1209_cov_47.543438_g1793_i0.p2  ORF type:complete len:368 (+),score=107.53 NODE_1808_length_1209_cov_47.543438_g1793_i0:24-1127(+)